MAAVDAVREPEKPKRVERGEMEEQLNDDTVSEKTLDQRPPIDPLRRVWVPIEKKMPDGNMLLRTTDKTVYIRLENGAIMRAQPKLRGKAARKADKKARQHAARTAHRID